MLNRRFFYSLAVTAVGIVGMGCGGGGKGGATPGSGQVQNNAPTVSGFTCAPADATLNPYINYSFTASASDPDIGDSVAVYTWDFGDGSAQVTSASATVAHAFNKGTLDPAVGGSVAVKVRATDTRGLSGDWVTRPFIVTGQTSPVTVTFLSPASAVSLQVANTGTVSQAFQIQVTDTAGGTVSASGIAFQVGDPVAGASIVSTTDDGGGKFTITAQYQPGVVGTSRTATPSVVVTDSNGLSSPSVTGPVVTLATTGPNTVPTVAVTAPVSPTTAVYSSVKAALSFTLTDLDGDPVSYSVNWGDGTTADAGTATTGTAAGAPINLTHAYPDTFTATTRNAVVTIAAQDNRGGAATSQTRTFAVTYNTYPVAIVSSPQASGTLPSQTELPSNASTGLYNPATSTSPDLVVIPAGGSLAFSGSATTPASGGTISYQWSFPGGVPSSSTLATPTEVVYPGVAGQITPYLATLTVTDDLSRASSAGSPANLAPPTPKSYQKWVIVDGSHTQNFNLSFLYRQRVETGSDVFAPATLAANGYGATVQIFQDGQFTSVAVKDQTSHAVVQIPVRSNLPFYVKVPAFGSDTHGYLVRIPNAPTGPYADASLGTTLGSGSTFGFGDAGSTSGPWNPTLRVVTAQGFGTEVSAVGQRRMQGSVQGGGPFAFNLLGAPGPVAPNVRWMDRLSISGSDATGATQWVQNSNNAGAFSGIPAYQEFSEWTLFPKTWTDASVAPKLQNFDTTPGTPTDMGFIVDYPTYSATTKTSDAYSVTALQAFRVPASTSDPYDFNAGANPFSDRSHEVGDPDGPPTGGLTVGLNATDYTTVGAGAVPSFLNAIVHGFQGTVPLGGGIQGFVVPFDANDPNRLPDKSLVGSFNNIISVFSYADYLWSRVWARPFPLNRASLNASATYSGMAGFSGFLYANPRDPNGDPIWPKSLTAISPDNSRIDLTANGYTTFDASQAPVGIGGTTPSSAGVGHFYWTAYTPFYSAAAGSVISRTWLADGNGLFPTAFAGASTNGDALSAWGFTPPINLVVDKRGRDATGALSGQSSGGYRITWFNPTKDAGGNVVPPDFWVVDIQANGATQDFMLPANYPTTQLVSNSVLTDARTFLPSGAATYQSGDTAGPGYCWFDLPVELRPTSGTAVITVFAVKSLHTNASVNSAQRALNRTDWIEAVKTATPNVKVLTLSGDVSFGHKIVFNYPWDIVVANSAQTFVAP
ncbi:PKD domain-containing protein [Geothrix sp. 21YS21S-4]|uniref:PKD domain-containing protein n=1 Tax=Geothrix sp. 21YS21S-4 TaxID=3068889 RepID=UPI0027BB0A00|nr:PKD domain-containing protein [Geothrix sp. 21YS21S-4]